MAFTQILMPRPFFWARQVSRPLQESVPICQQHRPVYAAGQPFSPGGAPPPPK